MKFKPKRKKIFLHRFKYKHHPLLFRRTAFLWVLLIILEIACPLFECQGFAGDSTLNKSTVVVTNNTALPETRSVPEAKYQKDAVVTDHQSQTEDCYDECLCHITPINVLVYTMPKDFQQSLISPIRTKFHLFNDLPPPYQPPQFI